MLFQNIFSLGFIISVCTHCRHDYLKQQWENQNWCPAYWLRFNGSCYFFSVYLPPVTWDLAQGSCFLEGAQLVEIESAAEQTFLVSQTYIWSASSTPVWIGLHDREKEGTYSWVSTGKVANYTNWRTDEPQNNYLEDCVQIKGTGLWNALSCTIRRRYICERPVKSMCPLGWTFFRGSCYSYDDTKYTSYTRNDAEIACKADESHLVEITSAAENTFVANLMRSGKQLSLSGNTACNDMAWIGLGDRKGYGTYVWYSSGEVANYTNWEANEPDVDAGQYCVLINLIGLWYSARCSFTRYYICERHANVTY